MNLPHSFMNSVMHFMECSPKCTYESLSGTNVARDFVELPSQFMENYAYEKEWLDTWASSLSDRRKNSCMRLIERLRKLQHLMKDMPVSDSLGFAFLDMAWHTLPPHVETDI